MDYIKRYVFRFMEKYKEDQISLYSTQSAFFLIISAVPFLMILLTLLKTILPLEESTFITMISNSLPKIISNYAAAFLRDIQNQSSTVSITSINTIMYLYAGSKCTYALTQSLNAIHKIEDQRHYIRVRLQSIFNTLLLMLLIIFSLVILVYGGKISTFLEKYYPKFIVEFASVIHFKNLISFAIITIMIAILYIILPGKHLNFIYQIPGACATALSWILFSNIYSYFIDHSTRFSLTYGVLSNIVFMMIWLQWCMTFFLVFAQINAWIQRICDRIKERKRE
ncbi:YihY/virulence factor BrkB family protein [Floccifex sp.]|uniref:YihY/virulence factor BrkB family protein n=1 Tax=Floccifex sp. TaxID=2815810 RepID=UPI003F028AB5